MSRREPSPALVAAVQRVAELVARHRAEPCCDLDTITRKALAAFVDRAVQGGI